ncbi:MAG TPA: tRNA (N6-isopentenyl adenosine(37)-C2)-methylthiotransferase MiaB [Myxococcota bacterium]|nr:tRNA (N6-isopentenyl adenosine(37)-C2)-methylthiotransferase MiaB [Myxococcota bacterium]
MREPRFYIRAFGCQMNQHDAGKMANLLHHAGWRPAEDSDGAELVVVHTCSVREKAEHKLYTELGWLLQRKKTEAGLVIGVGGCVAQQEGEALLRRFPGLDFVFGPQNLVHLPELVRDAQARTRGLRVDYDDDPQARFELPELHPGFAATSPGRAYVTVMEGCDLFCAYCVVPRTRGREVSRSSEQILGEVRALAAAGISEVTLLGQTVNAYGRPRPGMARGELGFAELLRRVADVPGIRRIRFTSPHPSFVGDDLVQAYRDLPQLCPHLHLPVQSGSARVLADMNRRYRPEEYVETAAKLREARPGLALTTDLIVGFPTETREDFAETLQLMATVRFTDSFSFKYSERPGTPAQRRGLAELEPGEAQARLEEVQRLQASLTLAAHRARVGETVEVLVDGESRRSGVQRSGRDPQNRLVNFSAARDIARGEYARVAIEDYTPHSLLGRETPAGL